MDVSCVRSDRSRTHPRANKRKRRRLDMDPSRESSVAAGPSSRHHPAGSVASMFQTIQEELDAHHDKYESLVKLSRDLTIESKRIIFLLHRTVDSSSAVSASEGVSRRRAVLAEAEQKLSRLLKSKVHAMADLLQGEDCFRYRRAYSPGLQECIEALTLHSILSVGEVPSHADMQKAMTFRQVDASPVRNKIAAATVTSPSTVSCAAASAVESVPASLPSSAAVNNEAPMDCATASDQQQEHRQPIVEDVKCLSVHLSHDDYLLGLADTTGELMRIAINSIGKGDLEQPAAMCHIVRDLYNGFLSAATLADCCGNSLRGELQQKTSTMRQSLGKIENACYMLKVRGSERPVSHLVCDAPPIE